MLAEHQLQPRLNDYPVVVIAQAQKLNDQFRDAVVGYVQRGGTLVLLDFESTTQFEGYLEVERAAATSPTDAYLGDKDGLAPAPGWWSPVELADAEVLEYRTDGQGSLTRSKDGSTTGLTDWTVIEPAITMTGVVGGKMFAVHGPLPQAYYQNHNPILRKVVGRLMEKAFPEPAARLLNSPNVDLTLRQTAEGDPAVHLVNLTGAQRADRFGVVDDIPGSGKIKLRWRLDEKPEQIRIFPDDKKVDFKVLKGENPKGSGYLLEVEVDDVPIHSILTPKFGNEKVPET
jgi:hypothetical protein